MERSAERKVSSEALDPSGRAGLDPDSFRRTFIEHLYYTQGRVAQNATMNDVYTALSYTIRDQLLHRWVRTGVVKIILNTESKIDLFSVPRFGILHLVHNTFVIPACFWRESREHGTGLDSRQKHAGMTVGTGRFSVKKCRLLLS